MPDEFWKHQKYTVSLASLIAAGLLLSLALVQSATAQISDRDLRESSIDGHIAKVAEVNGIPVR